MNHLSTDHIITGTNNKFITNNTYNENLLINATLTASNLNIIGTTTTITTTTYQTENLEIITQATDGPALKVVQNGTQNIIDLHNTYSNIFTITKEGNVGVDNQNPNEKLDIKGNIKIAGHIIPTSNISYDLGTSNNKWRDLYLSGNTIYLGSTLISTDSNTKGLVLKDNNNNLVDVTAASVKIKNPNAASYVELKNVNNKVSLVAYNETGNETDSTDISLLASNVSNYVLSSSNSIINRITTLDSNTSNYVLSSSNSIINRITTSENNVSNYVSSSILNSGSGTSQWITSNNNIYYNLGNVGIGTWNPASKLHIVGDFVATGNVTAYYSDERLKNITSNITNALDIIDNLNGFYYTPNELAYQNGIHHTKQEIGLSAQQVQKVLPELVHLAPFDLDTNSKGELISKSGENYLTMSYDRLAAVFVESIKELKNEIKLLKEENNDLKQKYNDLQYKILTINDNYIQSI